MNDKLLTREEFKKQVFARTNGKCCVPDCSCDAVDAHHIMDRKLWNDGGYYLSNGAALCEKQCLDYMNIKLTDIKVPDVIKDRYKDKIINFKDFYITLMLDALINKWGE